MLLEIRYHHKALKKMSFSVNNKVISYTDKIQDEYIIWFVDSMPKLYILAKSTKNFII